MDIVVIVARWRRRSRTSAPLWGLVGHLLGGCARFSDSSVHQTTSHPATAPWPIFRSPRIWRRSSHARRRCLIVPVHAQHRGRLFLPFADEDPKTAEILSKVLLLARDDEYRSWDIGPIAKVANHGCLGIPTA